MDWFDRVSNKAIGILVESVKDKAAADRLANFDINKQLTIVKLGGIGISMVDFNPRELCYFSVEGLVLLQEVNTYKDGSRTKTFTKIESSVRNL